MKTKLTIIALLLLAFSFNGYAQKDVSGKSNKAIAEIKKTNDKISKYFNTAYGYAVFPSIGKGGLGVGGAAGNGTIYKGGAIVGDCKMTQITISDMFGRVISVKSVENTTSLSLDNFAVLSASNYILKIKYSDGTTSNHKIVRTK